MNILGKRLIALLMAIISFTSVIACGVRINPNRPLQEQFNQGAVTYKVSEDIDLGGKTINIPDGATISFRGGRVLNGTLSGSFYVKGVKKGSFGVSMKKGSKLMSPFPIFNFKPEINTSVISACVSGIFLKEDINISSDINLKSSLDGEGHTIAASSSSAAVLRIIGNHQGIVIRNLRITRKYSGEINKNYALICENSSNIAITDSSIEGRLYFVNKTFSENPADISSGFVINNCLLSCDLSSCKQGWEFGQDHLAFYSIRDISITNCKIFSTNVNRVLKTSQYFPKNDYSHVTYCTDNILFKDNTVIAKSDYGKQMWDMYCGSTNVTIQNNTFEIEGFTRFIENKAYQDKYSAGELVSSQIFILDNKVKTIGSDLFQFRTSPKCDLIEIRRNSFNMGGPNKNVNTGYVRNCGGYLQGFKQMTISDNSFKWADEAVGLMFLMVNFACNDTIIENNDLEDVYRINISNATHPVNGSQAVSGKRFKYSGNKKVYSGRYQKSREEIYVSDVDFKLMDVDIENNAFNNSYEIIFAKNASIDNMAYGSKSKNSKSYLNQVKTSPWKHRSR